MPVHTGGHSGVRRIGHVSVRSEGTNQGGMIPVAPPLPAMKQGHCLLFVYTCVSGHVITGTSIPFPEMAGIGR